MFIKRKFNFHFKCKVHLKWCYYRMRFIKIPHHRWISLKLSCWNRPSWTLIYLKNCVQLSPHWYITIGALKASWYFITKFNELLLGFAFLKIQLVSVLLLFKQCSRFLFTIIRNNKKSTSMSFMPPCNSKYHHLTTTQNTQRCLSSV